MTVHARPLPVAEFDRGLGTVLGRLVRDEARWIVIADVENSEGRYVQFLAGEDGVLHAEVSSNASLRGAHRLSAEQQDELERRGWSKPQSPRLPNFFRAGNVQSLGEIVEATTQVLHDVFGLENQDRLFIKLFRSALDDPPARGPVRDPMAGESPRIEGKDTADL